MSHLEVFLSQECNQFIRERIEAVLDNESVRWKRFELNLYNVIVERDNNQVVLEDVLDGYAEPQRISLSEFREALTRCSAGSRSTS
jgi:hypothetical protein